MHPLSFELRNYQLAAQLVNPARCLSAGDWSSAGVPTEIKMISAAMGRKPVPRIRSVESHP
jgi:hypothetical protein